MNGPIVFPYSFPFNAENIMRFNDFIVYVHRDRSRDGERRGLSIALSGNTLQIISYFCGRDKNGLG